MRQQSDFRNTELFLFKMFHISGGNRGIRLSALESYVTNKVQRPDIESTLRDWINKIRKEFKMVSCTICSSGFVYQHVRFTTLNYFRRNEILRFHFIANAMK